MASGRSYERRARTFGGAERFIFKGFRSVGGHQYTPIAAAFSRTSVSCRLSREKLKKRVLHRQFRNGKAVPDAGLDCAILRPSP
jgi:hypothetical protein